MTSDACTLLRRVSAEQSRDISRGEAITGARCISCLDWNRGDRGKPRGRTYEAAGAAKGKNDHPMSVCLHPGQDRFRQSLASERASLVVAQDEIVGLREGREEERETSALVIPADVEDSGCTVRPRPRKQPPDALAGELR